MSKSSLRKITLLITLFLSVLFLVGCGSEEDKAIKVTKKYIKAMQKGDLLQVLKLGPKEIREMYEKAPKEEKEAFKKMAKEAKSSDSYLEGSKNHKYEVVKISADSATVKFSYVDKSGKADADDIDLLKEDGKWVIAQ